MRAAVLEEFGWPLVVRDLPTPVAGPGEVLVRISASGVNPLDVKIHAGQADHARVQPPFVLGLDLAGVVEAVGPEVAGFAPGDEVYGLTGGVGDLPGSLAQFAAVDARLLAHKPESVSPREAAALPLAAITAWEGLVDRAGVHAGQRVLVHGGAGGVGSVAVQIARARGAEVFATVSPARAALVEALGATPIDRTSTSVEEYPLRKANRTATATPAQMHTRRRPARLRKKPCARAGGSVLSSRTPMAASPVSVTPPIRAMSDITVT